MYDKNKIKEAIKNSYSWSSVFRKLNNGKQCNGRTLTNFKNEYKDLFDTSHFTRNGSKPKYKKLKIKCPVCLNIFETDNSKKSKTVCSKSCSNTYFRSGKNNPNWSGNNYRKICFSKHKKECVICGEKRIVEVHHYDCNHKNNSPENLIPLCPTHHQYFHSKYRYLVDDKIKEYVKNFLLR